MNTIKNMRDQVKFLVLASLVMPWLGSVSLSCAIFLFILIPVCQLFSLTNLKRFIQRKTKCLHIQCVAASMRLLSGDSTQFKYYLPQDFWQDPKAERSSDLKGYQEWTADERRLRNRKLATTLANFRDESLTSIVSLTYPSKTASIPKKLERDILISNHQIYTDWIYVWHFIQRMGRCEDLSIVLKASLRSIPIIGPVSSAALSFGSFEASFP